MNLITKALPGRVASLTHTILLLFAIVAPAFLVIATETTANDPSSDVLLLAEHNVLPSDVVKTVLGGVTPPKQHDSMRGGADHRDNSSAADHNDSKRHLNFWGSIGDWFTGCPAGNEGDNCSAGCTCKSDYTCLAWEHVCVGPGDTGDSCHLTKPCGSGLSCQPGVHRCYHSPRWEGEPCIAGYGCSSGLTCEAGAHVCRAPGDVGDACHLTRPCGSGLNCHPGVQKCYHVPRLENEPCVAGYGCSNGLTCEAGSQICRRPSKVNEACHLTRPCESGLSCEAGSHICRLPSEIGEACHLTRPCQSWLNCAPFSQICLPYDCIAQAQKELEELYDFEGIYNNLISGDGAIQMDQLDETVCSLMGAASLYKAIETFVTSLTSCAGGDVPFVPYIGVFGEARLVGKVAASVTLGSDSNGGDACVVSACGGGGAGIGGGAGMMFGVAFTDDVRHLGGESTVIDHDLEVIAGAGFAHVSFEVDDQPRHAMEFSLSAGAGVNLGSISYCYAEVFGFECNDVDGWYDSDGEVYDCAWYGSSPTYCDSYGDSYENFGHTASSACCVCNTV